MKGETNIALTNRTMFMWKKLRIKSLLIKKKPSEVIEVVFEKCDKSRYVSVE